MHLRGITRKRALGCLGGGCAVSASMLFGLLLGGGLVLGLTIAAQAHVPALAAGLAALTPPAQATGNPPPPPAPRKAVQVCQADGAPVAGVRVQIVAAGQPMRTATTDATGTATFVDLGPALWLATFRGSVQGHPIQPPAAQGQPPAGTNPAGNGFPLFVEPQSEDSAPTPVVRNGVVQPEVQISRFVLLPAGDTWIVTWDLAESIGAPLPYSTPGAATGVAAPPTGTPGPAAQATVPSGPNWTLAVFLTGGLFILGYTVWDLRRQERAARRRRVAPARQALAENAEAPR